MERTMIWLVVFARALHEKTFIYQSFYFQIV